MSNTNDVIAVPSKAFFIDMLVRDVALLDAIVDNGSPVMANRTAALLGQMFKYGIHRRIVADSPVKLLYRPGGKEKSRERALTDADGERAARVAVIGTETARKVFDGLDPVGRTFKINGVQFEVVGLLVEQGGSGFGSADRST